MSWPIAMRNLEEEAKITAGYNYGLGCLHLSMCVYLCVVFLGGLIVIEESKTVLEATTCPSQVSPPSLLYPSFPLPVCSFLSVTSVHTVTSVLAHLVHSSYGRH